MTGQEREGPPAREPAGLSSWSSPATTSRHHGTTTGRDDRLIRLPHPRRSGTFELDPVRVSAGVAEVLRDWAAHWAKLTAEAPYRFVLTRRLDRIHEHVLAAPLDRVARDLRSLADHADEGHEQGRTAAWRVLLSRGREAA
jgi:hypothetical protein